jgi:hypothetical protein
MHILQFRDAVIHKVNVVADGWLAMHSADNSSIDLDGQPSAYLDLLKIELDKEFMP